MRPAAYIVASLLSWSAAVLSAQPPQPATIIRVPVRLVSAPTLVFSKEGRLVPGLAPANFQVFDNGRAQEFVLDLDAAPVSVVFAVQTSREVRSYLPFIRRTGSALESLLVGETGEAAVVTYDDAVTVAKPFGSGDVQETFRKLPAGGKRARMLDAGERAVALLNDRPHSRAKVLVFIGQSMDRGSEARLAAFLDQSERDNVTVYALTIPEFGKDFVSDTFQLEGLPRDRGGFRAGADLGKLIAVLSHSSKAEKGIDPFTLLATATGGRELHFRKQPELEAAISAVGVELRSAYILSYAPTGTETGFHTIRVQVDLPGAITYSRPGYWLSGK